MLCVFTAMLGLGIIGPIMPLYAKDLGATFVEVGLLSSAWSLSRLMFAPLIGRISDVRSKKKIIASGLGVYMILSILYTAAWDFSSLLSMRFLHGIGSALATPVAIAYAAEITPEGKEGRYMGMMNLAMFGGMGFGPFIGGYLTDLFSLHAPFYVMGALTALSLILNLLFLPDSKPAREAERAVKPSYGRILGNRALAAVFTYRIIGALGQGIIFGFLSIFISGSKEVGGLGLPLSVSGTILSVGQLSSAFLQRPFGDLADKHSKVSLALIGGILGILGFTALPMTSEASGVLAASFLWSMGGALAMPAMTAIVAIEGKELGMGSTMSVLDSAMSGGMIVGPLVAGLIIEATGLRSVFYFSSVVQAVGMAAFYTIIRKART